jgi:hypothetical protein
MRAGVVGQRAKCVWVDSSAGVFQNQSGVPLTGQPAAQVKPLAQQTEGLPFQMSDQDWISYKDRWRNSGEEAAARRLIGKYGPQ